MENRVENNMENRVENNSGWVKIRGRLELGYVTCPNRLFSSTRFKPQFFLLRSAASIVSFTKALRKPGLSTKSINDNLYKQTLQNYKNKMNSLAVNCKSTV